MSCSFVERLFGGVIVRYANQPFVLTMATYTNRLQYEKSPYLLQHSSNPVDWYPWGEEAFQAARKNNKLIFLSVGYSTCHWCHVMERESFENDEIAKIMNDNFINVKVDREERPDVDKVYMTFVTASSGRGGWPMSVFLTPELIPVAGGTYFPPQDKYGRPGFKTMLSALSAKWTSSPEKFKESGNQIMDVLKRKSKLGTKSDLPSNECFVQACSQFSRMYEPEYGGFGDAPKFPQPSNFNFLFTYHTLNPGLDDAKSGLKMCLHTLDMMDRGGIHDHVSQGFARYSTDTKWHVPHFEKMLYDQAQLLSAYLDAYIATRNERYAFVAGDIVTYVMRDLSHPLGGFYSAEDADSFPTSESKDKREGAFCVWTHEQIKDLLNVKLKDSQESTLAQVFCFHYSVAEGGNVDPYQDPHDELKNQNVLLVHGTMEETAAEFGIREEDCVQELEKARLILYDARAKRPRPHLDDKMLTAWNGMMLGAMARAGSVLNCEEYSQRAIKNANFIKSFLWSGGRLRRAVYKGLNEEVSLGSEIEAYADDYAWMIRGLIHLYKSSLDESWLLWAEELQEKQNELFWDDENGGYFMTKEDDQSILLRIKEDQDGAEPSVNSVSSGNLVHLWRLLNRTDFEAKASDIFKLFSKRLQLVPMAVPEMVTSLLLYQSAPQQIIISGDRNSSAVKEMLQAIHSYGLKANVTLLLADTDTKSFLYSKHDSLKNFSPPSCGDGDRATTFICQDFTCSLPLDNIKDLRARLLKDL